MNEHDPDFQCESGVIKQGLITRIGEYTVLDLERSNQRLIIPTNILYRAGIVSGFEGDEFDPDMAVETVREHAFDPTLN